MNLKRCYHGPRQLKAVANRSPPLAAAVAMARNKGQSFEGTAQVCMYRVGRPICRKVLKIMFWEVPPADWLILWLPTSQAGPRNSHGKT